jgi:hypothetical protein
VTATPHATEGAIAAVRREEATPLDAPVPADTASTHGSRPGDGLSGAEPGDRQQRERPDALFAETPSSRFAPNTAIREAQA